MIALVISIVVFTLIIIVSLQFLQPAASERNSKSLRSEIMERKNEVLGEPSWEAEFQPIVEMARDEFPSLRIWGQYIHGGKGYGIFFASELRKSLLQVKSAMIIDGKEVDNDIRLAPNIKVALKQGFEAIKHSFINSGEQIVTRLS